MLRLQNVEPSDMEEVVRVANELHERETDEDRERRATTDAAEEMGIPRETMERAAAIVQARRIERVRAARRRRRGVIATLAAAIAIGGTWVWLARPAPPPAALGFEGAAAREWTLNANPETQAELRFANEAGRGQVAVVRVDRFVPQAGTGRYFANLDLGRVPAELARRETVRISVRGSGLRTVRLYIENGPNERWRSPAIPVEEGWTERSVRLDQFEHQVRESSAGEWRTIGAGKPRSGQRLSLKTGQFMNDATARGEVAVDEVRFE